MFEQCVCVYVHARISYPLSFKGLISPFLSGNGLLSFGDLLRVNCSTNLQLKGAKQNLTLS